MREKNIVAHYAMTDLFFIYVSCIADSSTAKMWRKVWKFWDRPRARACVH